MFLGKGVRAFENPKVCIPLPMNRRGREIQNVVSFCGDSYLAITITL